MPVGKAPHLAFSMCWRCCQQYCANHDSRWCDRSDSSVSAVLIQNCMVIAGIGNFGVALSGMAHRFPSAYRDGYLLHLPFSAIAIAGAHGMGTLIGAVIIGGLVEGTLGLFGQVLDQAHSACSSRYRGNSHRFSLSFLWCQLFAGGQGAADFGSMNNWVVGSVILLACLLCQIFAKGFCVLCIGRTAGRLHPGAVYGTIDFSGLWSLS